MSRRARRRRGRAAGAAARRAVAATDVAPFGVVDGHLRSLSSDCDLAGIDAVHAAVALPEGAWVVGGPGGALVLVDLGGTRVLRLCVRDGGALQKEPVRRLARDPDGRLIVGWETRRPLRIDLPRFEMACEPAALPA